MKPLPEEILPVLPKEYQFDWNNPTKKELEKIPELYFHMIAGAYFINTPVFQLTLEQFKKWAIKSIIGGKRVKIKIEEDRVY